MSAHELTGCELFRARLERVLAGRTDHDALRALGWREHLFACGACRALLESEQALDVLLDALPAVDLPHDLVERVLARLAALRAAQAGAQQHAQRDVALDRLLSRDPVPAVPRALGARVYEAVQARRAEDALERLLERVHVEPAPAGLAQRVVAALEAERAGRTERIGLSLRWTWAAAVLALVSLGAWILAGDPGVTEVDSGGSTDVAEFDGPLFEGSGFEEGGFDVDPDLLASLEVLENWEHLLSEDVDVLLGGMGVVGELAVGVDSVFGPILDDDGGTSGFGGPSDFGGLGGGR